MPPRRADNKRVPHREESVRPYLRPLAGLMAATLLTACHAVTPVVAGSSTVGVEAQGLEPGVQRDIDKYRLADTALGVLVRQLPAMSREKPATVLSYRAMDNDLAPALPGHLDDLEQAGSSSYANLLALSDGDQDGDTVLHYLIPDATRKLMSPYLWAGDALGRTPRVRELDSSDPAVLEQYVGWGFREYPGRFKVLDVASHGSGYQGMCMDFAAGYHQMPLPAFGSAIRRGLKGRKLDVLNLLACLMATVEVGYEFRDSASMLVASEDLIMGGRVMVYSSTFGHLSGLNSWERLTARDVAKQLVTDAEPQVPGSGAYTMAAIDLDRIGEVKRQVNVLANLLITRLPAQRATILAAYDRVPVLRKDQGASSHRDLLRFCHALEALSPDAAVIQAARELEAACGGAIALNRTKKLEKGIANGLSIYMPEAAEEFNPSYLATRFAADSSWDELLQAIRQAR